MNEEKKLICVLCGKEWPHFQNVCSCGGFCSWGYELNEPESFTVDKNGNWHLKPVQNEVFEMTKNKK